MQCVSPPDVRCGELIRPGSRLGVVAVANGEHDAGGGLVDGGAGGEGGGRGGATSAAERHSACAAGLRSARRAAPHLGSTIPPEVVVSSSATCGKAQRASVSEEGCGGSQAEQPPAGAVAFGIGSAHLDQHAVAAGLHLGVLRAGQAREPSCGKSRRGAATAAWWRCGREARLGRQRGRVHRQRRAPLRRLARSGRGSGVSVTALERGVSNRTRLAAGGRAQRGCAAVQAQHGSGRQRGWQAGPSARRPARRDWRGRGRPHSASAVQPLCAASARAPLLARGRAAGGAARSCDSAGGRRGGAAGPWPLARHAPRARAAAARLPGWATSRAPTTRRRCPSGSASSSQVRGCNLA